MRNDKDDHFRLGSDEVVGIRESESVKAELERGKLQEEEKGSDVLSIERDAGPAQFNNGVIKRSAMISAVKKVFASRLQVDIR